MSIAVAWALASLICAGLVDLTYKRYAMGHRSRGLFLGGMGAFWLIAQLIIAVVNDHAVVFDALTLKFGVAAGLAVTLSNLLLIESLTHLNVSLGSTIYRLNTIAVVLLAYVILGESVSTLALLGIGAGVCAVVLLYQRDSRSKAVKLYVAFVLLAVLAALLRATFGVVSKAALEAGANQSGLLIVGAICWMAGGAGYAVWRERPVQFDAASAKLTLFGGLVVFGTVNTLLLALQHGKASVVIPIANLGFVVALGAGVAWKMERFTARKCLAMLFAVAAIFLLSI